MLGTTLLWNLLTAVVRHHSFVEVESLVARELHISILGLRANV